MVILILWIVDLISDSVSIPVWCYLILLGVYLLLLGDE